MSFTEDGVKINSKRGAFFSLLFFGVAELALAALFARIFVFPERADAVTGVPARISYQGRLTDINGNPKNGTFYFCYSIYDAQSGGTKLWPTATPTATSTLVSNGVFNAPLGEMDSLASYDFSANATQYLNVEVSATSGVCGGAPFESLTPRQPLNAVPYARVAQDVWGTLLRTDLTNSRVQVGTGSTAIPIALDSKNTSDTIGGACSPNGTMWYNSNASNLTALVCNNGAMEVVGTPLKNQFFDVTGPATSIKTFTFPNANATVLTSANAVTAAQGGTGLDSSAWNGPVSVAAGTWVATTTIGIPYGGTGQTTKSAAFDALDPLTTKGDIIVGNATGNAARFGVGTNGQVLTASTTATNGVDWMTSAAGAPSTATYITQTADAGLSGEQALSTLATGYMKVTTGTGVVSSQAAPIPNTDGGTGQNSSAWNGPISAAGGVWVATTTINAAYGGTGNSTYAIGDILYASGNVTLSRLADVAAGSYLRSGGVTTAPVWSTLTLPNAAVNGGACYSTASGLALTAAGTSGQMLRSAGAAAPVWATSTSVIALSADYTNGTTGLTNTALAWTSPANVSRSGFHCELMVKSSSATYGTQIAVNSSVAPTTIAYKLTYLNTTGTAPNFTASSTVVSTVTNATALGPTAGLTTYTMWQLEGVIVHTASASTVTVQAKSTSSSNTSTIGSGSFCEYYVI